MLTATEAYRRAQPGRSVIGWKLDREERAALLARFPPRYADVVADHVTLRPRVQAGSAQPPPTVGVIVGHCDDGTGVQAMVVQVDGSTERPDGGTYHVTWSLQAGRSAVESNEAIRRHGWQPIEPPVPLRLRPAVWQP